MVRIASCASLSRRLFRSGTEKGLEEGSFSRSRMKLSATCCAQLIAQALALLSVLETKRRCWRNCLCDLRPEIKQQAVLRLSKKMFSLENTISGSANVGRLAFAVVITISVTFTVYFGVAAWRASSDAEITGTVTPIRR
jgi:hypothetical protein